MSFLSDIKNRNQEDKIQEYWAAEAKKILSGDAERLETALGLVEDVCQNETIINPLSKTREEEVYVSTKSRTRKFSSD